MHKEVKFIPRICYHALASKVLVVMNTCCEGTWCAYCDAVPGIRHDNEFQEVLATGDKLPERVARAIFPEMAKLPYAH